MLRNHLLAAAARLDRGRRLACPARAAARRAARQRPAGPGPPRRRRVTHPGAQRGDHLGPSPVDRARPGSKHHLICGTGGIPLAVTLTGGNRNDITQLIRSSRPCHPFAGAVRRPRLRPRHLPAPAARPRHHSADRPPRVRTRLRLGRHRWVVERRFAWVHAFKRLRTRYERRADIHLGLLRLACALICYRHLPAAF